MITLPIVNEEKVLNVEVHLKGCEVAKESAAYDDAPSEDVIVNRTNYVGSVFDNTDDKSEADFIRSKYLNNSSGNNSFLVTTKYKSDERLYRVYRVQRPTRKVNDGLEKLYSSAIRSLRKETPPTKKDPKPAKGKYLSLKEMGLDTYIAHRRVAALRRITQNNDPRAYSELLRKNGLHDLKEMVDFISRNFEFKVKKDDIVDESTITAAKKFFSKMYTKEYKNLNDYYKKAQQNADIFNTISYVNKLIYGEPLKIQLQVSGKELVKKKGEVEKSDKN